MEMMAHGKGTFQSARPPRTSLPAVSTFRARAIDTDHDGTISKDEFVA